MNLQTRVEKLEQTRGGRDGGGCELCANFGTHATDDDLRSPGDRAHPFNCVGCGRRAVVIVQYIEKGSARNES
jgi:hypothetical protein